MVLIALAIAASLSTGQAWKASTAPGPSSASHQKIAGDCDSCHMPFKGLPNQKCLACHGDLKKFHASVAAQKCKDCHGGDLGTPEFRTKIILGDLRGLPAAPAPPPAEPAPAPAAEPAPLPDYGAR